MAYGKSLTLRYLPGRASRPVTSDDKKERDRSLIGKARVKARRVARH